MEDVTNGKALIGALSSMRHDIPYREDLNKYPHKMFQQYGARSHSSKLSRNMIKFLFKDKFIPTWEDYLKINDV